MLVPVDLQPVGARLLVREQRLLAPRGVLLAKLRLRLPVRPRRTPAVRSPSRFDTTSTARDASSTWTTGPVYSGAIFTAVCCLLVVAPPISSGMVKPRRFISFATKTISSSDGVISPLRPDDVGLLLDRRVEDLRRRHHHAEVDHLVVVAAEHHADDVLADVVDVALHRGHQDPALRRRGVSPFSASMYGSRYGDRLLHRARALDDLRQEHLARAEQVADDLHAVHQRAFDDLQRPRRTSAAPPRRPAR